jgi:transcriptional regulator with XRE-family HTH domain
MKTPIYEARKSRGWTSRQLNQQLREAADRLGLKVSAPASLRVRISDWENDKHGPDATHQLLLQEVFDLPAEALGFDTSDDDQAAPSPLRGLVQRDRHEVSESVLRYFTDQLAGHARADNAAGPGFVLATADLQLRQLEDLAQYGAPEVGLLAARYAEFTGWLLQDSGDDAVALRHTDRAVELAEAFGDTTLTAYNLMRKSCVLTTLRERHRAASVAQKAIQLAEQEAPHLLPVCLRQYALAQSYLRDERKAKPALQHALDLAKPTLGEHGGLSSYCTTSYVQMEAALCLLALGNPAAAADACVKALEQWPAELVRDESLCLTRLAVAYCQLHEVEEACDAAQHAIELVKTAPSARAIHMLRVIAHKLAPFKDTRSVVELTQSLAEVA